MDQFDLYMITNKVKIADYVLKNGCDYIFVDFENMGKLERQKNQNTPINSHTITDLNLLCEYVSPDNLLVRINSMHSNSKKEINEILEYDVNYIMLPYFKTLTEVKECIDIIDGRTKIILLMETKESIANIENFASLSSIDRIHLGLNDLKIDFNLRFLFEGLVLGLSDLVSQTCKSYNMNFGIGGVGKLDSGLFPANMILEEHARLGSTSCILSRVFHNQPETLDELKSTIDFRNETSKLKNYLFQMKKRSMDQVQFDHKSAINKINEIINHI